MTVGEYARKTFEKLSDNPRGYKAIIAEAERVLINSGVNSVSEKQFWIELYNLLNSRPHYISESQGGDSLSKIIADAKSIIAKKAS
ncbi:hypothetical protein [Rahnella sp. RcJ3]|uniref:hypothetical protein n=1 Tax=Rahnella sp. RcJ3 TaxID=2292446 RepID=UPI0012980534|nr:hypothetical protein [Rahnella sp. RcJ3]MQB55697.1 hypothetical protein [Rahnella sp. RcJ3]